jgi:hypothetical protein
MRLASPPVAVTTTSSSASHRLMRALPVMSSKRRLRLRVQRWARDLPSARGEREAADPIRDEASEPRASECIGGTEPPNAGHVPQGFPLTFSPPQSGTAAFHISQHQRCDASRPNLKMNICDPGQSKGYRRSQTIWTPG